MLITEEKQKLILDVSLEFISAPELKIIIKQADYQFV